MQPHFNYSSEVWDTLGEGLSKRLQKLQNRSARIITHMSIETTHQKALKALGWETLVIQRIKAKAKYIFRVVNSMAPACLTDLFTRKQDVTNYNLRSSSTSLQLPLPETENGKKAFHLMGQRCGIRFRRIYAIVNQCPHLSLKLPLTHYFNALNFYSKF